ncbi:2332_t:CDS:2 [Paraglomus brasilianum]|uniref:2332_t:CDS:1 n=1 Tax=Paraglomus brasilianum TaxID=144538 RepID=A0A9N9GLS7_9GLOM|nr:2332_t:CDS:2 [Paraglomus brasilianum]
MYMSFLNEQLKLQDYWTFNVTTKQFVGKIEAELNGTRMERLRRDAPIWIEDGENKVDLSSPTRRFALNKKSKSIETPIEETTTNIHDEPLLRHLRQLALITLTCIS